MNVDQSIFGYVKDYLNEPDKIKIEYYGSSFTEREFLSHALRVGGYLTEKGFAGKTAGIMLPNIPEAVFALYGASAAGCAVNLINPRFRTEALERILLSTGTKILFVYDKIYPAHRKMLEKHGIEAVVCSPFRYRKILKILYPFSFAACAGATRFSETLKSAECVPAERSGEDVAVYIHSGGTTGTSKAAEISNRALNSLAEAVVDSVHPGRADIPADGGMLAILPIFHGFGLGICVHTVICHIRVVLMPLFRAREAARLIKKYAITHIAGVPQMFAKLAAERSFGGKGLEKIECVFCGGDKLAPQVKERFDAILRGAGSGGEILEGYGLTETASVVTVNPRGATRACSQGLPLKGNRVKITNERGETLPAGEIGNIELAAVSLMNGYLNDEECTAKAVYTDDEGVRWLRTGDYGCLDADGYLYFKERVKRTVKIAAINIFPSDIEAVVNAMDEVEECCAARAADSSGKPYVRLYVKRARGAGGASVNNKIATEVASKIVRYAVPREIIEVDELRHTPFGKVDYRFYEKELQGS